MLKTTKITLGIIVVIAITAFVYGISNKKSENSREIIKIGALMPLTGQISSLGENMQNGMELARETMIEDGVVKDLEIIYEDACDGKTTTNAVQKLIFADKVNIIGSGFCLFGLDTIVPTVEKENVILFNTAANPETTLNKDFVFSTNINIRDDAHKIAEYAANNLQAKKVALIYLDTSFGHSYYDNFKSKFTELGGTVLTSHAKTPDTQDFRSEITKIKSENPDAIVVIHFGISLGNALKQIREQGITVPIIGDYESEDQTVLEFAGKASEGLIISSSQSTVITPEIQRFEEKYFQKYGKKPDVLAANTYDALMLQVQTYQTCSGETICITKELRNIKNYSGVSGMITVNPDHSVSKSTVFKVVKNGKFVEIK